jgi:hypothetical protein
LAKEKRYHCPDCADEGIVKQFGSFSALEMHRGARHAAAPVRPVATTSRRAALEAAGSLGAPPNSLHHRIPGTEPARPPRPVSAGLAFFSVIALIALGVFGYLYWPAATERFGDWLAGDPTARHD